MEEYKVGDSDQREWGSYEVTDVGTDGSEEFCTKTIIVNPKQMLSLQMHDLRREEWIVNEGTLTVICNGNLIVLEKGESVNIPLKAIHCMINMEDVPVSVVEIQRGVCREEDNHRFADFSGREVEQPENPDNPAYRRSINLYNCMMDQLREKEKAA